MRQLLRVAVAHAGNDHRLGANEAPPAIISIFLGDSSPTSSSRSKRAAPRAPSSRGTLTIGVDTLPPLPKDAGDRNRTSPFAFTGNKFEFRAVGSSQSIAGPLVVLNTIVAETLDYIATELEKATGGDAQQAQRGGAEAAARRSSRSTRRIIFNGDNYSRGVARGGREARPAEPANTVDALPAPAGQGRTSSCSRSTACSPSAKSHSRYEIYLERYCKDINIESLLALSMAKQMILPAAYRYQGELAIDRGLDEGSRQDRRHLRSLDKVTELVDRAREAHRRAGARPSSTRPNGDVLEHAKHYRDAVIPAMLAVRKVADELEDDHRRRPLAAADVPRDAVHQVTRMARCGAQIPVPSSANTRRPCAHQLTGGVLRFRGASQLVGVRGRQQASCLAPSPLRLRAQGSQLCAMHVFRQCPCRGGRGRDGPAGRGRHLRPRRGRTSGGWPLPCECGWRGPGPCCPPG